MPSGGGSGIILSSTFTPAWNGKVVITCRYEAQGTSGGDWGSAYLAKPFIIQNSSTTFGDSAPLSTSRLPAAVRNIFDVIADAEVEYGLYCAISGAVAASFWSIGISAHFIRGE